ncbi:penicillin acylase family protein [Ochrobactrum sp. CM-21-5]|nr:penicillin acylase family protein [Ochrobactrum sp. CM-21-5]MBC2887098.1 penicillin acylase family protein [Ochrobactrum sp. CM-21-5]
MNVASGRPETNQQIRLDGISGAIDIHYDIWGIPHIRARSTDDLFFANGYAHAADRLWQMDAARRRALGRFAAWAGKEALSSDVLMRRLGLETVSKADYAALSPETRRMCERYCEGVNAWIASGHLSAEYTLLGEKPELWEGWHCVLVMRQRGILMGSLWFKLWRAAAFARTGRDYLHLLRYEDGGVERFVVPQERSENRWSISLEQLAPAIEGLMKLFPQDATGGGSNNWAVDARHSTTGMPIVAGDPHRTYEIPGMYAQIHLTCDSFDVLGLSVPGVPGFPHFAHNKEMAWCVTHAFADIHDLYVEDFSGLSDGAYRTEKGTERAQHHHETIEVRGNEDVQIDVWSTRHGPLILGSPADGTGIALKSVQLQPGDRSLDCLLPMLTASNVTEFYDMMGPWGLIDHNLVSADRKGNIGVLVRAHIPERDRLNGWLPVPGWTGEHEWRGMIPFERSPREENPTSGIIVTANNRTVPDDWPDYICTDCHPATRAKRIRTRLENETPFAPSDMLSILHDDVSAPAAEIAEKLRKVTPKSDAARRLLSILSGWQGDMAPNKLAPTAYIAVRQQMTRILARVSDLAGVADTEISRLPPGVSPLTHLWWALPDQLRRNDVSLLDGLTWDDVLSDAIETVAQDFNLQAWGDAHRPVFRHPLAGAFPDHAQALAPSSQYVGGDGDCVLATGALPQSGATSMYGPVAKYIWNLADWDSSSWVVFHGASGDPASPHYRDQNERWAHGEQVPAYYSRESVEANSARHLVLQPSKA